jgi:hypothetical protein
MEQGITDVPLSFLSKLSQSRDVMMAAEIKATELAKERGSGMRNTPLAPPNYNGGEDSIPESSSLKERFMSNVLDEGTELLSTLPPHLAQQNQYQQPMRPMVNEYNAPQMTYSQPKAAVQGPITESLIDNSGMPEAVKRAMKQYPTSVESPVNEVDPRILAKTRVELMDFPEPPAYPQDPYSNQPAPQRQQPAPQRQQLSEQGKPVVRTSEAMIRKLVQEEMMAIMTKNIREQAIKDTINTLRREGIIPKNSTK